MYGMKKPAKPKLIKGPGTGTSDSIQKDMPDGSYVMPADSTTALGFGPTARAQKKQAPREAQQSKGFGMRRVNVSNGEMELPPEAVHQIGAAVLDQVRDATHQPTGYGFKPESQRKRPETFFADGGLVGEDEEKPNSFGFNVNNDASRKAMQGSQDSQSPGLGAKPLAGYAANVERNREALNNAADNVGGFYKGAAEKVLGAATVVPRGVAGLATGSTTFDSNLPDYGAGERERAAQRFVRQNPEQAEAANRFAEDTSRRTLTRGLAPRLGYPGIRRGDPERVAATEAAAADQQAAQADTSTAGQASTESAATAPANPEARGWGMTGVAGVAGRRNADGVMEFSDRGEALESARGFGFRAGRMGDGNGGLSVAGEGDGARAMESNRRAVQEMRQTRLENSNPNYLTVVRNSGARGVQGLINRRMNERDSAQAAERSQQHQRAVAEGQQRLDQGRQQQIANRNAEREQERLALQQQWAEDDRKVATEDRDKLRSLRDQMMDTQASVPERMEARRQYMALTVDAGDRYQSESVQYGTDSDGKPVLGNRLVDVTTGEYVSGEPPAIPSLPQGMTREQVIADAEKAISEGAPREAVNQRLAQFGLSPI